MPTPMHAINVLPSDEVFSHTSPDGVVRHFNTSAMVRALFQRKVTPACAVCPLTEGLVSHIRKNHGVEEHHLSSVDSKLDTPILLVEFETGETLLVDGNHRVVRRWDKGFKTVDVVIFKPGQWEAFLIVGFDEIMSVAVAVAKATEGQRAWATQQEKS